MNAPPHESLIRRVLANHVCELKLHRLAIEEIDGGSSVKLAVLDVEVEVEVEGRGVGLVDALFAGLLERYAREYQSLSTLQLTGFQVAADIETKKAQAGVDSIARVILDVANSDGRVFSFTDASRSVTSSTARAVLAMVSHFVNAERAFLTLYNARRDALARGREDLVSRYTAEMAAVVESTSYAEVIANIRKEIS
ncbi:MAG TPA: alpha-isopropylmalate synthase regulatory domain-containing protein [Kofleriaceae bacterium]